MTADVDEIARDVLGLAELRPAQRSALTSVLGGRDTLAVLPTGSGKSAIYQVAGIALGGLTVVVSPLVALQHDQLRAFTNRSRPDGTALAAADVNGSQPVHVHSATLDRLRAGELDVVLLGPEQLSNPVTRQALLASPRPITLVAVDEAHLVSQWGHEFRPDYLRLGEFVDEIGHPPVLALTATAAPPVQADITRELRMRDAAVVVAGFDRPNISLAVRHTHARGRSFDEVVEDHTVEAVLAGPTPALVYAASRTGCERLAGRLRDLAWTAQPYHAGLPARERTATQDAFLAGRIDVVVATSAFGMGIDKPDVRSVVHAGAPASLDEYYQEIGRAGRDGRPARAVLVFDPRTLQLPRLFASRSALAPASVGSVIAALPAGGRPITVADLAAASRVARHTTERVVDELEQLGLAVVTEAGVSAPTRTRRELNARGADEVEVAAQHRVAVLGSRVDSVRHYAETVQCRRAELLAYFGEAYAPPCGSCDNDVRTSPPPPVPAAPAPAAQAGATVAPGDPVIHRLWGPGTVLSVDPHELVIAFESVGYRHLTPAVLRNGLVRPASA